MSNERDAQHIDSQKLSRVVGKSCAVLIATIACEAQRRGLSLFLVGGVVRDLLLAVPNHDLDFVLESDAIHFADSLADRFGGSVLGHKDFGTAIWSFDAEAADRLALPAHGTPQHVDFARARLETYEYPSALPTVTPTEIKFDLRRRDFTLNTLALQLSPASDSGRLIDEYGGHDDLRRRLIRVLHERSFIDDPTRILRALRLGARLGFDIEARTEALLRAALPLLGRLSGHRLTNELEQILQEKGAGTLLLHLQRLGALSEIHPALRLRADLPHQLAQLAAAKASWQATIDERAVAWCLLLAEVDESDVDSISQRLNLSRNFTRSITACCRLMGDADVLRDPDSPPSAAARLLDGLPESTLCAASLLLGDSCAAQKKLADYIETWRHQRACINGNDLACMGIPPGPRYRQILEALRFAWIDGKVCSPAEERAYLGRLLAGED